MYLPLMLPSCGVSWGCRAKHQKLKTGNDQSPGDKKPETETDQRMFNRGPYRFCYLELLYNPLLLLLSVLLYFQSKVSALLFLCSLLHHY